jgi:VWFA-related protein
MRHLCLSLLLLFIAYGQQPETAPETKITVEVRRVPVDVIVTDTKGNPVSDLKKEDFVILEGRKPQEITSFSLERASAVNASRKRTLLPEGFVSNAAVADAATSDLTVILFDELNTSFSDAAYARSQMEKLLTGPALKGHPVSLLLLNSQLLTLHDFTDDPQQLLTAFTRHTPFLPIIAENESNINLTGSPNVLGREADLSEKEYHEVFGHFNAVNRAETTLQAMRNLANSLRDRPGRKRVIWFSAGFPITFDETLLSRSDPTFAPNLAPGIGDQRTTDMALLRAVSETSLALTHARVAVYPIDVRGLMTDPRLSAANRSPSDEVLNPFVQDQGAMQTIAEQTGGEFVRFRNDLAAAAAQAVQDGSEYYALTYRPVSKQNGDFKKIEVKVDRPGVRVRFRNGYFAANEKKKTIQQSPFYEAAIEPLQRNALQFAAIGLRTAERSARFMIVLSPDSWNGKPLEAGVAKRLEVALVETAGPNKLNVGKPERLELKIDQKNVEQFASKGLAFVINFRTTSRTNRVRLVLRDTDTGQLGSLDVPLQKPTS